MPGLLPESDTKMVFGDESLAAHLARITSLVEDGTMIGPGMELIHQIFTTFTHGELEWCTRSSVLTLG